MAAVTIRLSARELLNDPFLQLDDCKPSLRSIECQREQDHIDPLQRQPFFELDYEGNLFSNNSFDRYSSVVGFEDDNGWGYNPTEIEQSGIELFEYNDDEHDEHSVDLDITIKGKRREDGSIFIRLRITDREGRITILIGLLTSSSIHYEKIREVNLIMQCLPLLRSSLGLNIRSSSCNHVYHVIVTMVVSNNFSIS